MSYLKAEWGGVYRAVPYPEGGYVATCTVCACKVASADVVPCLHSHALMKEAYVGEPSRAYFPLTEEFAKGSNNSTVGLTNSAIIIPDTQHITGDVAYYVCSSKVRSEVCAPISRGGQVIGIIDVEAWDANHFSDLHIGVILMVCAKLGERNLFV